MENLLKDLLTKTSEIVAGLPIKWDDIADQSKKSVMICALHCVLNGPVGVNKKTNFPLLPEAISIKSLVTCSNSNWRSFCLIVADLVKKYNARIICNTINKNGEYWPLHDW